MNHDNLQARRFHDSFLGEDIQKLEIFGNDDADTY